MAKKYEGNYLESADLMQSGGGRYIIAEVVEPGERKDATGRVIDKYILGFENSEKDFICGSTSFRNIKAEYGQETAGWIGKEIAIGVRYLKEAFGESNVPSLRVIPRVAIPFASRKHMGQKEPFEIVMATESEVAEVQALAEETKADIPKLLNHYKVPSLDRLTRANYVDAINLLNMKRGAK